MEQYACKMQLKKGYEAEYKKRHDEIWEQLVKLLQDAGIYDYSIYLDPETLTLFSVQKREEGNTADQLAEQEIMRKWWDYMADIMEVNPDNSPVCTPLIEVFHMD